MLLVQPQTRRYLAVYEIDTGDVPATLARLRDATWLNMSDAIDPASIEISLFTALGEAITAGPTGQV